MVGALGSEAGFADSMLNQVISMMHVLHYHKNPKLQLSGLNQQKKVVKFRIKFHLRSCWQSTKTFLILCKKFYFQTLFVS